ncbi:MAG TPA: flagellar hook-associated protein FlgK [Bradyrhizobium sp.]|jgi:flagellar hook-associated protein 1 FlgK|nr:flagellar hook-associated protein FlgK [Bradyrhizobium sp.]
MSLSSALSTIMAGLSTNQAALSIVSSNVANSQTPGYVTRTLDQVEVAGSSADAGASVRAIGVNRQINLYLQSQLRTETSGGAYADQISNVLGQLQSLYGTPGGTGTLEATYNNFTSALQALSANSGASSARSLALTTAQSLAQELNTTTQGIQALRSNAEQDIGASVNQANNDLAQIAQLNAQLQSLPSTDNTAATLMDQRDNAINDLSKLMDIRVVTDSANQATVYTTSGLQLVGNQASLLSFSGQGTLNASSLWNSNPAMSRAGTLTLTFANGASVDLIATNSIGSGRIGADLKLRDSTLVQAQTQLDQLAATLSSSLSDITTAGTAVTSGSQSGFDVDLSNVLPGNSLNLTYTDTATNTPHQITIVRVDDPTALPLANTAANPNDKVIGVNFQGGMASIISQLTAAIGNTNLQFSNPSGSTLRVLDNGAGALSVNAASTTVTASALANGNLQLLVFTDGSTLYTGVITGRGTQLTGFAGRITVNAALVSDPSKFIVYNTSPLTTAGDTARSDFLYSQLTAGSFTYSPQTGLGSRAAPLKGTLPNYLQQFLGLQSNAATSAQQLAQGQDVVVNTLQQKFNSTSGVNIDAEMSSLIALQNTYAANAHIMSVVQSMMQTLMQIQL